MPDSNKLLYEEHCALIAVINAFALETTDPEIAGELYALVDRYKTKVVNLKRNIDFRGFRGDGGAVP
jgi:hypothetical protein